VKFIAVLTLFFSLNAFAISNTTTVSVEGMTCVSCARAIERSFKQFPEVKSVKISINSEKVTLTYNDGKSLTPEQIRQAIKEAGPQYAVTAIQN
jgi:copper chaperone CopZ